MFLSCVDLKYFLLSHINQYPKQNSILHLNDLEYMRSFFFDNVAYKGIFKAQICKTPISKIRQFEFLLVVIIAILSYS
jgi:hypothetical protein